MGDGVIAVHLESVSAAVVDDIITGLSDYLTDPLDVLMVKLDNLQVMMWVVLGGLCALGFWMVARRRA